MTAPTLASPVQELARLRAENEQLRAVVIATDPATDPEHWRAIFRDGHQVDLEFSYRAGYAAAERDMAASWARMTETVVHPERGAERRLRAAEAGCRRDAAEFERSFVARAHNTHDRDRTDVQRGTVRLYPGQAGAA